MRECQPDRNSDKAFPTEVIFKKTEASCWTRAARSASLVPDLSVTEGESLGLDSSPQSCVKEEPIPDTWVMIHHGHAASCYLIRSIDLMHNMERYLLR